MSGRVLNWAARVTAGDITAKAVLLVLAEAANDDAETIIGQDTVAGRLETSRETVTRAMKRLELRGLITRLRRRREGGYRTSDLVKLTLCDPKSRDFASRDDYSRDRNTDSYVIQDHSLTPSVNPQTINTPKPLTRDKPKTRKATPNDPAFEALWLAYPHFRGRSSKRSAFAEWSKLSAEDRANLVTAVCEFGSSNQAGGDRKFVPAMERWIKNDLWRDFIAPMPANTGTDITDQNQGSPVWRDRLRMFDLGKWSREEWGPEPGRPGCQVPSDLLAELNINSKPALTVIPGGAA